MTLMGSNIATTVRINMTMKVRMYMATNVRTDMTTNAQPFFLNVPYFVRNWLFAVCFLFFICFLICAVCYLLLAVRNTVWMFHFYQISYVQFF